MTRVNDDSPLLRHADFNLWGNPEENNQYQVKVRRISSSFGEIKNFNYMNKWRILPKQERYFHIFTVGGLNANYWGFFINILKRNPIDKWVNLGDLATARGMLINIYDDTNINYSKQHAWIMVTYDGLVLLALDKLARFPIDDDTSIYFRCYRATRLEKPNSFRYVTLIYENSTELNTFTGIYRNLQNKNGYTFLYHNGVFVDAHLDDLQGLKIGDVVELVHDPSVIRRESYKYDTLQDFYSSLDKKRKVIIHSPKRKGDFTLRYFDDNDYYLVGHLNRGLYISRNEVSNIRQLTHNDVSIDDDYIRYVASWLPDLDILRNNNVVVFVRATDWDIQYPYDAQRLRYLYRLSDNDIVKALTGERSNMEEWLAENLEKGPVLSLMNNQFQKNNRSTALAALGYNASTRVVSESVIRATREPGALGVTVPFSYRESFCVFEYDANGLLLGIFNEFNTQHYNPKHDECEMLEFTLGEGGRSLDERITNVNTKVDPNWDLRVYVNKYSELADELVGEPLDVTGTDVYRIEGDMLIWDRFDPVNERGILITNKKSLVYTFTLDHLDKSLAFAVTHIYDQGGLLLPMSLGQVDLWMNGHPLIDNVDWIYKDGYIYILAKEYIRPGAQEITIRAMGLIDNDKGTRFDTELGFVEGGVIGNFNRYNLRGDRVTRTVIGGRLYITDEVPRAERSVPDDQWSELNGLPYMVKHCYTPVRYAKDFSHYPLLEEARATDARVSGYLTKWGTKPTTLEDEVINEPFQPEYPVGSGVPAIPNIGDKYRVFSPFLNVIVNNILNKIITVPEVVGVDLEHDYAMGDEVPVYSKQQMEEVVGPFKWWLEFDPVILGFDRRYFAITPYANYEKLTINSKTLQFLKEVTKAYLRDAIAVENYFDINNNG